MTNHTAEQNRNFMRRAETPETISYQYITTTEWVLQSGVETGRLSLIFRGMRLIKIDLKDYRRIREIPITVEDYCYLRERCGLRHPAEVIEWPRPTLLLTKLSEANKTKISYY